MFKYYKLHYIFIVKLLKLGYQYLQADFNSYTVYIKFIFYLKYII